MCEKETQLIAIICLFDFVCGTQNLVSSFDFQEGHLDNPDFPTGPVPEPQRIMPPRAS